MDVCHIGRCQGYAAVPKTLQAELTPIFSNREIALGIWIVAIFLFLMVKTETRNAVLNVVRVLFSGLFVKLFFLLSLYVGCIVYLLNTIGLWHWSMIKETVMWFLLTATVHVMRAGMEAKTTKWFRDLIVDNVKFMLLLEFVVSRYTFSIIAEAALVFLHTAV